MSSTESIYAVEHTERTLALVMELVEGDDLVSRIARGIIAATIAATAVKPSNQ